MIYKFSTFIVTSLTISVFKTKAVSKPSQNSKHKTLYFKIVKNKEQTSLIWILDNNYIRVKIIYPSKYVLQFAKRHWNLHTSWNRIKFNRCQSNLTKMRKYLDQNSSKCSSQVRNLLEINRLAKLILQL